MNEHGLANTSEFTGVGTGAVKQQEPWKSAQALTERARKQASEAGEYVVRNVAQYPFEALLLAGAIGYGIGFLIHTRWSSEPRQQTSARMGHSDDVLLGIARARITARQQTSAPVDHSEADHSDDVLLEIARARMTDQRPYNAD